MELTIFLDGAAPYRLEVELDETASSVLQRVRSHFELRNNVSLFDGDEVVPPDAQAADLGWNTNTELHVRLDRAPASRSAEPKGWRFLEHTYPAFDGVTRETLQPLKGEDAFIIHYLERGSGRADFPDAVVHSSLAWQGVSAMVHMKHPTEHRAYFLTMEDGCELAVFEGCFQAVGHGASNVHCPHMWWTRSPTGDKMLPPNGGHVVLELVKGNTLPLRCLRSSYPGRSYELFEVLKQSELVLGCGTVFKLAPGDEIEAEYKTQRSASLPAGHETGDILFKDLAFMMIRNKEVKATCASLYVGEAPNPTVPPNSRMSGASRWKRFISWCRQRLPGARRSN